MKNLKTFNMKKYFYSFIAVIKRLFHTSSKSLTLPQDKLEVPILPLLKVKSRKKHATRKKRVCPHIGKVIYNENGAKQKAKKLTNAYMKIKAYHCLFDTHWHITHEKQRRQFH